MFADNYRFYIKSRSNECVLSVDSIPSRHSATNPFAIQGIAAGFFNSTNSTDVWAMIQDCNWPSLVINSAEQSSNFSNSSNSSNRFLIGL